MDIFQDVIQLPSIKKCFEYESRVRITEDAIKSGRVETLDFILSLLWNQQVVDYYVNNNQPTLGGFLSNIFINPIFLGSDVSDFYIYDFYRDTQNPTILLFIKYLIDYEEHEKMDYIMETAFSRPDKTLFIDIIKTFPQSYDYRPDELYEYKNNDEILKKFARGKVAETTIALKPLNLPSNVLENIVRQAYDTEGTLGLYNTMETIEKYRK